MKSNEMICKPLDQVFKELAKERPDLKYFRELDRKQELQAIEVTVKSVEGLFI